MTGARSARRRAEADADERSVYMLSRLCELTRRRERTEARAPEGRSARRRGHVSFIQAVPMAPSPSPHAAHCRGTKDPVAVHAGHTLAVQILSSSHCQMLESCTESVAIRLGALKLIKLVDVRHGLPRVVSIIVIIVVSSLTLSPHCLASPMGRLDIVHT